MKKNYFYAVVLALWCGTAMGQLNNFQESILKYAQSRSFSGPSCQF